MKAIDLRRGQLLASVVVRCRERDEAIGKRIGELVVEDVDAQGRIGKGAGCSGCPRPGPARPALRGSGGSQQQDGDEQGDSETGNRANRVHDVLGIDLVARPIEQGMDAMDAPERGYPPLLGGEDER
jgi:hypothetical protein